MNRRDPTRRKGGRIGLVLLAALSVLGGCEEDISGPDPHQYPYSMWGVLNPRADTQFVRVFPIERTLDPGTPEPLDARFVSTDLATGEERVWRDSVIIDSLGAVGHVFYAPFRPDYEHTYRLDVTGPDGRTSWVEVEMPGEVRAVAQDPDTSSLHVRLPVVLEGTQPRLIRTALEIYFGYVTGSIGTPPFETPVCHFVRYFIPYDQRVRTVPEGWRFTVNLTEAYGVVRDWVMQRGDADAPDPALFLYGPTFHAVVGNEAWAPPDGVFDPNVLVQPGVMENVQNGFGLVVGGYRLSRTWSVSREIVEKTDFALQSGSCEQGQVSVVREEN